MVGRLDLLENFEGIKAVAQEKEILHACNVDTKLGLLKLCFLECNFRSALSKADYLLPMREPREA